MTSNSSHGNQVTRRRATGLVRFLFVLRTPVVVWIEVPLPVFLVRLLMTGYRLSLVPKLTGTKGSMSEPSHWSGKIDVFTGFLRTFAATHAVVSGCWIRRRWRARANTLS